MRARGDACTVDAHVGRLAQRARHRAVEAVEHVVENGENLVRVRVSVSVRDRVSVSVRDRVRDRVRVRVRVRVTAAARCQP